jgi:hypothetical protein
MALTTADTELMEFHFHGFLRALRRYRAYVIAGWAITLGGAFGFAGAIHGVDRGDLFIVGLPVVTMAAGILIVHLSIVFLETYVSTPFPVPDPVNIDESIREPIAACKAIMVDVAGGGWKEAFDAVRKLEAMDLSGAGGK